MMTLVLADGAAPPGIQASSAARGGGGGLVPRRRGAAGDGHEGLARARVHVGPGDVEDEVHESGWRTCTMRTRSASVMPVGAGEITCSPSERPDTTSIARVPRMPTATLRARARPPTPTNTWLACPAVAAQQNAIRRPGDRVVADALDLYGDQSLDLLEVHGGAFERLGGGGA